MLDSISKLTGLENYTIWSASMTIILKGIKKQNLGVDGVFPVVGADIEKVVAYKHLCHTMSTTFIQ